MNYPQPSNDSDEVETTERRSSRGIKVWREGDPTHKSNPNDGYTKQYEEHVWRELAGDAEMRVICPCGWSYVGPTREATRRAKSHKEGDHSGDRMSGNDVRDLILEIRSSGRGYSIVTTGRDHYKVVDSNGKTVMDEAGPITIASTPSDPRTVRNDRARLRRAGVLTHPDAPKTDAPKKSPARDLAAERAAREAEASRKRQTDTLALRSRLEPLVAKMGGWDSKGMQAAVGRALFQHAKEARLGMPGTIDSSLMAAHVARKGGTLSERMVAVWESFVDRLDVYENPKAELDHLVRAHYGIEDPPDAEKPRLKGEAAEAVADEARAASEPEKSAGRPKATEDDKAKTVEIRRRIVALMEKYEGGSYSFYDSLLETGKNLGGVNGWNPSSTARRPIKQFRSTVASIIAQRTTLLSARAVRWWTMVLDERERDGTKPPVETPTPPAKAARRPPRSTYRSGAPGAKKAARTTTKKETVVAEKKVETPPIRQIDEAPTLALRVFADLVTPDGAANANGAMEIAKEILKLEVNQILAGGTAK